MQIKKTSWHYKIRSLMIDQAQIPTSARMYWFEVGIALLVVIPLLFTVFVFFFMIGLGLANLAAHIMYSIPLDKWAYMVIYSTCLVVFLYVVRTLMLLIDGDYNESWLLQKIKGSSKCVDFID